MLNYPVLLCTTNEFTKCIGFTTYYCDYYMTAILDLNYFQFVVIVLF